MPWIQSDPNDPLSPRKYVLSTKESEPIERSPDKLPSVQRLIVDGNTCFMEVTGQGVLVFHEYPTTDDLIITVQLFTWDEIMFDNTCK